jgi:predicted kinase
MRRLALLPAALLAACTTGGLGGSYGLGPGVATYDALASATEKCRADGGVVVLKSGYDKRDLGSYQCQVGGAK